MLEVHGNATNAMSPQHASAPGLPTSSSTSAPLAAFSHPLGKSNSTEVQESVPGVRSPCHKQTITSEVLSARLGAGTHRRPVTQAAQRRAVNQCSLIRARWIQVSALHLLHILFMQHLLLDFVRAAQLQTPFSVLLPGASVIPAPALAPSPSPSGWP